MRFVAAAVALALAAPAAAQQPVAVDLELVLAVDVSRSIDRREAALQREGYRRALTHPDVLRAISQGRHGRVAVTYVEWSGWGRFHQTVEWAVIADADSARAFAERIGSAAWRRGTWTSISTAIDHAVDLFRTNRMRGDRYVIDISGDGPNNVGRLVTESRGEAVAAGITVNGLAILDDTDGHLNLPDLDVYYRECVIGGPGAFLVAANGFADFADAVRRKLVLEIAHAPPDPAAAGGFVRVQAGPFANELKYAPACDIGERLRELYAPGARIRAP